MCNVIIASSSQSIVDKNPGKWDCKIAKETSNCWKTVGCNSKLEFIKHLQVCLLILSDATFQRPPTIFNNGYGDWKSRRTWASAMSLYKSSWLVSGLHHGWWGQLMQPAASPNVVFVRKWFVKAGKSNQAWAGEARARIQLYMKTCSRAEQSTNLNTGRRQSTNRKQLTGIKVSCTETRGKKLNATVLA